MNAHFSTPEYAEGYEAFAHKIPCPYKLGSTRHALWKEGYLDAQDDEREAVA